MTPNAQHKRAERERRKAAGEVRVELWMSKEDHEWASGMSDAGGCSVADILRGSVRCNRVGTEF